MPPDPMGNLFETPSSPGMPEEIRTLVQEKGFRLERIVSHGQASAAGFWYDQATDEWVTLLKGHAVLSFEDRTVHLKAGDHFLIRAHEKHRVEETSEDAVWLALHWELTE